MNNPGMSFKEWMDSVNIMAESSRAYYLSFLRTGFTANQALKLTEKMLECATMMINKQREIEYGEE